MFIARFENPAAFQLLWWLPILLIVSILMERRQNKKFSLELGSAQGVVLLASLSLWRKKIKLVLELSVVAFFILALARPQAGETKQKIKSEGIEIMLVVDVSQSMMSEDVRPNRLEVAKKELTRFLDLVGGDKVGLVAFAGTAVTLSPLTHDKSALKMFLESLSPLAVTTQGTDFRRALLEAKHAFERGGVDVGDEGQVTRLVVVVSDGEDNEPGGMEVAREMAEQNLRIFTLSVGTEAGGPIPVRDDRGRIAGTLHDKNGQEVITKVVSDSLKELAQQGRGAYYPVDFGGEAIRSLRRDLQRLEKTKFEDTEITSYKEVYQVFLILGLLLSFLELFLSRRKKLGRLWRGRFEVSPS